MFRLILLLIYLLYDDNIRGIWVKKKPNLSCIAWEWEWEVPPPFYVLGLISTYKIKGTKIWSRVHFHLGFKGLLATEYGVHWEDIKLHVDEVQQCPLV